MIMATSSGTCFKKVKSSRRRRTKVEPHSFSQKNAFELCAVKINLHLVSVIAISCSPCVQRVIGCRFTLGVCRHSKNVP